VVTSHTEYQQVKCINTSGQTFAIWLNVVYLTPLTFLFVRFFIKSYLRRGELLAARQKALKGKVPNGNGHVANGKTH
jgi:GNS1/SUR4 family